MYLINSIFKKSLKSTIDHLEVGELQVNFNLEATK